MAKEQTQLEKYKEAVRDLECDDNENRFNETLKRIAPKPEEDKIPSKGE